MNMNMSLKTQNRPQTPGPFQELAKGSPPLECVFGTSHLYRCI